MWTLGSTHIKGRCVVRSLRDSLWTTHRRLSQIEIVINGLQSQSRVCNSRVRVFWWGWSLRSVFRVQQWSWRLVCRYLSPLGIFRSLSSQTILLCLECSHETNNSGQLVLSTWSPRRSTFLRTLFHTLLLTSRRYRRGPVGGSWSYTSGWTFESLGVVNPKNTSKVLDPY